MKYIIKYYSSGNSDNIWYFCYTKPKNTKSKKDAQKYNLIESFIHTNLNSKQFKYIRYTILIDE